MGTPSDPPDPVDLDDVCQQFEELAAYVSEAAAALDALRVHQERRVSSWMTVAMAALAGEMRERVKWYTDTPR